MTYTPEDILKVLRALEDIEIHESGCNQNTLFSAEELEEFISDFDCKEMIKDTLDSHHLIHFSTMDCHSFYSLRGIIDCLKDFYEEMTGHTPEEDEDEDEDED
jgi:hypothetical protein